VLAWRHDGFNGEIALSAEGLPAGITCPTQQFIGPSQKQSTLVLMAAPDAEPWTGPIHIKGTATIQGTRVEREARPATITWAVPQLNLPAISRLDRDVVLAVRSGTPYHVAATADHTTVHAGEKVQIKVKIEQRAKNMKVPLQLSVLNLPQNLITGPGAAQPLQLAADKDEATIALDVRPNVPPGAYTVVVRGQATISLTRDNANGIKQPQNTLVIQPSEPITLFVLPKQLATVNVDPAAPKVGQGKEVAVTVKVSRLLEYDGPFTLQLVVPDSVKGISAEPVTIAEGKDEAKLVVRVGDDAPIGNQAGLLIRTVGQWHKQEIGQETKFAVNVSK
jgi:hypothetical protein